MNKEQQIEEMAKIINELYLVYTTTETDIAEGIYQAGYRKIDENCAVITKAELKQYKSQAVREFVEKLKSGLGNCTGCYIPNCFESMTVEFAYSEKDLLKLICKLLKDYE
jgi:hypothetical protein